MLNKLGMASEHAKILGKKSIILAKLPRRQVSKLGRRFHYLVSSKKSRFSVINHEFDVYVVNNFEYSTIGNTNSPLSLLSKTFRIQKSVRFAT